MARHEIGPGNGKLILKTSRQGLAAPAGHDLTIEVTRWSGELELADPPERSTLSVTVETGSLRILEGIGGITPLSERDKREILANARKILDSDRQPHATFGADKIAGGTVSGTLTIMGTERPIQLEVSQLGAGRYRARGQVVQSEYGIRPYTALFGALKLADPVGVEAEVDVSGDGA